MAKVKRIKRTISRFLINHLFCGTRFFQIKRKLLCFAGVVCGNDVKVVGPIYFGNICNIEIGDNVWIGHDFRIYGNGKVNIGDNIDIAPEVAFVTGSHEINSGDLGKIGRRAGKGKSFEITVENGCWIGARTTIMGNTTIHHGAVVGACSLVNKNVDENCTVAGIPAKILKRFQ